MADRPVVDWRATLAARIVHEPDCRRGPYRRYTEQRESLRDRADWTGCIVRYESCRRVREGRRG